MYNIKEAAQRAGVSVPVLRAWERRYGVVRPPRTPSGYRRYDDATVRRVRTMRSLIDDGWSPSAAAAAILAGEAPSMSDDLVAEVGARDVGRPEAPQGSAGAVTTADADAGITIAERFVRAAGALDATGIDAILDDLFARGSFERVADDLLFPALRRLGAAWASGEVSVAGEHLASSAVLRRLGLALDAAGSGDRPGTTVVVGLPPGGRHELGALAFAVAARRAGLSVRYVGPDLPLEDWVAATRGADAAVVGIVTRRDRALGLKVASALRTAHPELVVMLGGAAAPEKPGLLRLDAPLAQSVAALVAALDRRAEQATQGATARRPPRPRA